MSIGKSVQVTGPVVDVEFAEGNLPEVLMALTTTNAAINDQPVSLNLLRQLAATLTEIHGQHDDRALVDAAAHRRLLDAFGGLEAQASGVQALWRKANVETLDAGPKGVVINFRRKEFPNPAALVKYIGEQGVLAKIRPDQSVFLTRDWPDADKRLNGSAVVMTQLARLAAA